jgi:hypothetical protein
MSNKTELYEATLEYIFDMRPEIKELFVKKPYGIGSIYFAGLKDHLITKGLINGKKLSEDKLLKHLRKNTLGMKEEFTVDEFIKEINNDQ